MQVITVANQKGGAGKTSTVLGLAAGLALRGYSCTIVDCDPQMNATQGLGVEAEDIRNDQFTVIDAYLGKRPARQMEIDFGNRFDGRLFLIPGHRGMSTIQSRFDLDINKSLDTEEVTHLDADNLKDNQRKRLKDSLKDLDGSRDFVFIDTGPEIGLIQTTALIAADRYIIPMIPSGFDLRGLKLLLKATRQIRDRYQPDLSLLGVLLTKVKRTRLDQEIRELLLGEFTNDDLFATEISDSVRHREATVYGKTIHEHAPG